MPKPDELRAARERAERLERELAAERARNAMLARQARGGVIPHRCRPMDRSIPSPRTDLHLT